MKSQKNLFSQRVVLVRKNHAALVKKKNRVDPTWDSGVVNRWMNPVLTAKHVPLEWRYDFNPKSNPLFLERMGMNGALNSGAIEHEGKLLLVPRLEGVDRKSFFAVAESANGVDHFRFVGGPMAFAENDKSETNHYDMRVTRHEDGWVYGTFCVERKDPKAPENDTSTAVASCGLVRTKDFRKWERLPDLVTPSPQQRNVVLHPEFIDGQYALYTRPQDSFIDAGQGGGIGWALCRDIANAVIGEERIVDPKLYHTIKEVKNGAGAPPLKTSRGWLHIAHGVRNTAAGLRYVLYAFLCDLNDPAKVIRRPGGYLLAPQGEERIGDVSNVVFCNGVVHRKDGSVLIYYASSDTRIHVGTTTIDRLLDYVENTPADPLRSSACVEQRVAMIRQNLALAGKL
jgi:4-O-beta-D-mannosyl-D-glucose phosphorylase